jgi:hypothetical protein
LVLDCVWGAHFQNDSEWQEWQEIYHSFKVKVRADIQGTGVIKVL